MRSVCLSALVIWSYFIIAMDLLIHYMLLLLVSPVTLSEESGIQCTNNTKKLADMMTCTRYHQCTNGQWQMFSCPSQYAFDAEEEICKLGVSCRNQLEPSLLAELNSSDTSSVISFDKLSLLQGNIKKYGHRIKRRTTYRKFRSTTSYGNGNTVTTLWYYNSDGPNYKFTIKGGLPAHKDDMIEWIEKNSHHYKLTPVPYNGDAPEETAQPSHHQYQPMYKPNYQHTTYKSFKSSTYTKNGNTITTLWYYNSEGPNYKFTIKGGLPAPRDNMIEWIEQHSSNYRLTQVPYQGDAPELPVPEPPKVTPLPPTQYTPPAPPPPTQYTPPAPPPPPPTPAPPPPPTPRPHTALTWDQILPDEDNCGFSGGELKTIFANKVVGGKPTSIEANPWQVALVEANSRDLKCGGSIISKKHVLTATHCFYETKVIINSDKGTRREEERVIPKNERLVYTGSDILKDPLQQFRILDIYLHAQYQLSHRRNDIALVLIDGDFTWSYKVYPICLPKKRASYYTDRRCRVSGWGKTASEKITSEENLHGAVVKVVESTKCKQENEKHLKISGGMFCAGDFDEGTVDTCQGDSGGPCSCDENGRGTLFGITSWGIGCGRKNYPGVYTKVALYLPWIHDRVEVSIGSKSRDTLTFEEDVGASEEEEEEDPNADII